MTSIDGGDLEHFSQAIQAAQEGLVDRAGLVETLVLAAVADEHVLIVGPPGTAKSEAVRRVAAHLGGRYFEYLLGRFTEPNEIFGPIDLRRLRDGVVEIETTGMLPEAEIAFLDEVFLGSTAILNTLLGVLNERVFRRGSTVQRTPLRLCVGATNALPDDVALAAFADRFLVRVFVDPVPDGQLGDLLAAGWERGRLDLPAEASIDALDRMRAARAACDLSVVRDDLATALRAMRGAGVALTDRRVVRSQSLVAAAATLAGRTVATRADLWPLPLIATTAASQPVAREALAPLLDQADSALLPTAAEELSAGPQARARRFVASGTAILERVAGADAPPGTPLPLDEQLAVEALLREIDAAVPADARSEELVAVRDRLVAAIAP